MDTTLKTWISRFVFDSFYVDYMPEAKTIPPEKCPISSREFFTKMQKDGYDTKQFRKAFEMVKEEWSKEYTKFMKEKQWNAVNNSLRAYGKPEDDLDGY